MKKKAWIGVIVLVVVCLLAVVLYQATRPEPAAGEKEITVVVVHGDGTEAEFQYQTDAEYLGQVLTDNGLVGGRRAPTACSSPPWTERRQTRGSSSGGASPGIGRCSPPAPTRPPSPTGSSMS